MSGATRIMDRLVKETRDANSIPGNASDDIGVRDATAATRKDRNPGPRSDHLRKTHSTLAIRTKSVPNLYETTESL